MQNNRFLRYIEKQITRGSVYNKQNNNHKVYEKPLELPYKFWSKKTRNYKKLSTTGRSSDFLISWKLHTLSACGCKNDNWSTSAKMRWMISMPQKRCGCTGSLDMLVYEVKISPTSSQGQLFSNICRTWAGLWSL